MSLSYSKYRDNILIEAQLGKIKKNGIPTAQIGSRIGRFSKVTDSLILLKKSFDVVSVMEGVKPKKDFELMTCNITSSAKQSIIKTQVYGVRGTVKEYITPEDISINIKGVLLPTVEDRKNNTHTPQEQAYLLNIYANSGLSIAVDCKFLNQTLGIKNVIIEDVSIVNSLPGSWEVTINLLSDVSINLEDFVKKII